MLYLVALGNGPSYHVKVSSSTLPVSSSRIKVVYSVSNSGTQSGNPTCTITATAPHGPGSGTATVTENEPVQPHQGQLYITTISVSSTAANSITGSDVKVTCS